MENTDPVPEPTIEIPAPVFQIPVSAAQMPVEDPPERKATELPTLLSNQQNHLTNKVKDLDKKNVASTDVKNDKVVSMEQAEQNRTNTKEERAKKNNEKTEAIIPPAAKETTVAKPHKSMGDQSRENKMDRDKEGWAFCCMDRK